MDFYVVLGVPQGATPNQITRAYRRLARRFHPDINPGDHVAALRFKEILLAYETLIDPVRRSRYDVGGEGAPESCAPRSSGFEGFDFSASGSDSTSFGDLFAEAIAARTAPARAQRGSDLHAGVAVSFEESLQGVRRAVTVTRETACRACGGRGVAGATDAGVCVLCEGAGTVRSSRRHMIFSRICPSCAGTGSRRPQECGLCGGVGRQTRSERVQVDVPPGTADSERVRVAGAGHAGWGGGAAGDLYLTVHVGPHHVFCRDGDDLHVVVPVGVHEAALGSRVAVDTPDGTVTLRVPPGTQSGQRFRLRGRGVASRQALGQRGDLLVEVRLMLPEVLDERSKELLREFGRIHGSGARAGARREG